MNGSVSDGTLSANSTTGSVGGYLQFPASKGSSDLQVLVRAGISFISAAHARNNLQLEQGTTGTSFLTFEEAENKTRALWAAELGRFTIADSVSQTDKVPCFIGPLYFAPLHYLSPPPALSADQIHNCSIPHVFYPNKVHGARPCITHANAIPWLR